MNLEKKVYKELKKSCKPMGLKVYKIKDLLFPYRWYIPFAPNVDLLKMVYRKGYGKELNEGMSKMAKFVTDTVKGISKKYNILLEENAKLREGVPVTYVGFGSVN